MKEPAETAKRRSSLRHVLIAHAHAQALDDVCDALRSQYVVRECGAEDVREALRARQYACVVCRVGGELHAPAFHAWVKASSWRDTPLVFVVGADATTDDIAYVYRTGAHWVMGDATPNEVVALVRAASTSPSP